jgi:hypothetical protein
LPTLNSVVQWWGRQDTQSEVEQQTCSADVGGCARTPVRMDGCTAPAPSRPQMHSPRAPMHAQPPAHHRPRRQKAAHACHANPSPPSSFSMAKAARDSAK